MTNILTQKGLKILKEWATTKIVYAFDFDGTLAPIVNDPDAAKMPSDTLALIQGLSKKVSVAVVSGRSLLDLKSRMGFEPEYIVGNHGIESLGVDPKDLLDSSRICREWEKQMIDMHEKFFFDPAIKIENKAFSLSVHYRGASNIDEAETKVLQNITQLNPPAGVVRGKCVVNVMPPRAPHKGKAVVDIIQKFNFERALYVGDDETDENVFALRDPRILSIRVGEKDMSAASYFIRSQKKIDDLLRALIEVTPEKNSISPQ